jgi:hypothetical protein
MPLLDLFWTILIIFVFVAWIWVLISVVIDVFRNDISGWSKALWVVLIVFLPILGVLAYLIVHGSDMSQRQMDRATEAQEAQDEYIRDVAGSTQADELAKLASLRDQGVLSADEYQAQKAKLLAV